MNYIKGYDPETLREIVDPDQCRQRLEEIAEQRSLPALMERVWLMKVLGSLDEALELGGETVRLARMAGTRSEILRARVLRASVLQFLGEHDAAASELETCSAQAEGHGWKSLAAFSYEHQGRNLFEAQRFEEARDAFKRALVHRTAQSDDAHRIEAVLHAIEAAERGRSELVLNVVGGV